MADTLINLIQTRTVLILAGKSVGTGNLVAPGIVLTCAHVVRNSIDQGDAVEILLPDPSEPGHYVWKEKAQQIYISRKYEESNNSDLAVGDSGPVQTTEYPDVAVIEISKRDHNIIAFPEHPISSDELTNGQFISFGFQKKDRDLGRNVPQAVSLNYSGEQVDGSIRKIMFTNGLIRPGMSGAALLNRQSGKIIGLVHMTMNPNDDIGAYVIPIEKIWDVFQKWEVEGVNDLYSNLKSKAIRAQVAREYRLEYPRFPLLKKYGIKLILLPLILFFGLWWGFYHLGPIQESSLIAVVLVAVSLFGSLLGDWLGDGVRTESSELKANIGSFLFNNYFLLSLGVFTLILWAATSSIWVYGNSESKELSISLSQNPDFKESHQKYLSPTGKTRFLLMTTPWGDSIALAPEGREPIIVPIRSFSKKEFYYPRDFLLEPVAMIRFDPSVFRNMDSYQIHIRIEKPDQTDPKDTIEMIDTTLQNTGAILIGSRVFEITKEKETAWKLFFEGEPIPMVLLDMWVENWKKMKRYPDLDLDIGDRISVKITRKSDGSVLNEQAYSIKDDETDKLLKFNF